MRCDNQLIIDSFQEAIYAYSNGNLQYIQNREILINFYANLFSEMTDANDWLKEWTIYDFGRKRKWCAVLELGKEKQEFVT